MIGKHIRQFRERLGISQEELAHKTGVHVNTIARWERDEVAPRGTSLWKLAKALGVSSDNLLTGDIDIPGNDAPPISSTSVEKEHDLSKWEMWGDIPFYAGRNGQLYSDGPPRGVAFWGSVIDAAEAAAERGNVRELTRIEPLLREALDIVLSSCKREKVTPPSVTKT